METSKQMIGAPLPRPVGYRLATGRGTFTDNISLPRMAHIAFVRSPYAHALIKSIDTTEADKVEGVIRIITGTDVAKICKTINKFPKYEFRNAKAIIIIVDLKNTWYLKTAIIESECITSLKRDI